MSSGAAMIALGVPELIGVVLALSGVIFGLIKYFYHKETQRVAKLENKVNELEIKSISRAEFNQTVKSLRDEVQRGNSETHRRLDQLLMKMMAEVG